MSSVEEGARELLISTDQDQTGVLVAVRDSGPGIDAQHLDRVFDAFYTTKSSGTGMGLSICRSHHGELKSLMGASCGQKRTNLAAPFVCYLAKPVDDDYLERCLRSALQPKPDHRQCDCY